MRRLVLLLALPLLGCAGESCTDPRRAGFFDGIGNLASGCYAREEARLSDDLAAAEARRATLRAEAEALEGRARGLEAKQAALARRVAAVKRELAERSRAIDRLMARQAPAAPALRAEEVALDEAARTADPEDAARVARLEAENRELSDRIAAAVRALGGATR